MTREEIKQMVNTCDSYYSCACCPYNPEDISRFIGDRWKGGCPNYDRKLVYAMGKGYGDVSEYEAEIEQLKAENEQLEEDIDMIIKEQKDDCKFDIKQAKIDILNEAKEKLNSAPNGWAYTGYIDEMIEELKK